MQVLEEVLDESRGKHPEWEAERARIWHRVLKVQGCVRFGGVLPDGRGVLSVPRQQTV